MYTNLYDLNTDILQIIGDYVKKDNIERRQQIRKKYVKLYEGLDTNEESERIEIFKKAQKEKNAMRDLLKI